VTCSPQFSPSQAFCVSLPVCGCGRTYFGYGRTMLSNVLKTLQRRGRRDTAMPRVSQSPATFEAVGCNRHASIFRSRAGWVGKRGVHAHRGICFPLASTWHLRANLIHTGWGPFQRGDAVQARRCSVSVNNTLSDLAQFREPSDPTSVAVWPALHEIDHEAGAICGVGNTPTIQRKFFREHGNEFHR